jgi:hypothetical protein
MGKYAAKYAEGTNVVVNDPDVAQYFSDHESVNEALRSLLPIMKRYSRKKKRNARAWKEPKPCLKKGGRLHPPDSDISSLVCFSPAEDLVFPGDVCITVEDHQVALF